MMINIYLNVGSAAIMERVAHGGETSERNTETNAGDQEVEQESDVGVVVVERVEVRRHGTVTLLVEVHDAPELAGAGVDEPDEVVDVEESVAAQADHGEDGDNLEEKIHKIVTSMDC